MAQSPGVFIVDQDPDQRFQLKQLIPQTGFVVSGEAALGTEAVAKVTETKPEIVLCGLREPLTRVVQTIESIAHALPETPIIVYSESTELEVIRKAMLAGARDMIQAPIRPEDLKRTLSAALEANERRRLHEGGSSPILGPQGAIIAVYGAKGGVGKTTVAANLGVALVRQAGQNAILVDADETFGDAAAVLALTGEHTIADAVRVLNGPEEEEGLAAVSLQHNSGLRVISSPASPFEWRNISADQVHQLLTRLARQYDVVVVDTASTVSDVQQAVLETASVVLWLTTPEYTSVRDSIQALQALRQEGRIVEDRIRIMLNMTSPEVDVRPASIEDALERPIFWTIPYDRLLRRSAQLGQPLVISHPESAGAENLKDLALVLSGLNPERPAHNGKAGLLQRLFSRESGEKRELTGARREE